MIYFIQILRALAVIAVIIFHLDKELLPGGYLGVDLFFVISGFVITHSIVREYQREGRFSVSDFFVRRVLRIFPALIFLLVSVGFVAFLFYGSDRFERIFETLPWSFLQVSNFYFAEEVGYFEDSQASNPLLHTWSLGVEEQFYLWLPFLAVLMIGNTKRFVMWISISASLSLILHLVLVAVGESQYAFYLPFSRFWQLLIGVLLVFVPHRKFVIAPFLAWLAALVLICGFFIFNSKDSSNGLVLLIYSLSAATAIYFGRDVPLQGSIFKPLLWIGSLSYSLYLWHWPIICWVKEFFKFTPSLFYSVSIGLTFVMAWLSYAIVERPLRSKFQPGKVPLFLVSSFSLVAFCALACFGMAILKDVPWRLKKVYDNTVNEQYRKESLSNSLANLYDKNALPIDSPFTSDVVLLGDSHAMHYYPAIKNWCADNDLSLQPWMESSFFPFADEVIYFHQKNGEVDVRDKKHLQKAFEMKISKSESVEFVFIAVRMEQLFNQSLSGDSYSYVSLGKPYPSREQASQENYEVVEEAVARFTLELTEMGKRVVLLGQVPMLERVPTSFEQGDVGFAAFWVKPNSFSSPRWHSDNEGRLSYERKLFSSLTESNSHVFYIQPNFKLPRDKQGKLLYRDDDHITAEGAFQTPIDLDFSKYK